MGTSGMRGSYKSTVPPSLSLASLLVQYTNVVLMSVVSYQSKSIVVEGEEAAKLLAEAV